MQLGIIIISIIASYYEIIDLIGLFILIASILSVIGRFHDLNKSAWNLLLIFIPFYNLFLFLDLYLIRGTIGENNFGKDPKYSKREKIAIKEAEERIEINNLNSDFENIEDIDFNYERESINEIIHSDKFLFTPNLYNIISSKTNNYISFFLVAIPFILIATSIILFFILMDWHILFSIPLVALAYIFNSPFGMARKIFFWSMVFVFIYSLYVKEFHLTLIMAFGIISIWSFILQRLYVNEILLRRAYYSKTIFLLLEKYKYFKYWRMQKLLQKPTF